MYRTALPGSDRPIIQHLPDSSRPPSPGSPPTRGGEQRSYESAYGSREDLYCTGNHRTTPSPVEGESRGGGDPAGKPVLYSFFYTSPHENAASSRVVRVPGGVQVCAGGGAPEKSVLHSASGTPPYDHTVFPWFVRDAHRVPGGVGGGPTEDPGPYSTSRPSSHETSISSRFGRDPGGVQVGVGGGCMEKPFRTAFLESYRPKIQDAVDAYARS